MHFKLALTDYFLYFKLFHVIFYLRTLDDKQVRVRTGVAQLLKLQSGHIWFGLVSLASFGQAWFAFGELI